MLNNFRTVTNTAFVGQARQRFAVAAFGENIFARYQAAEAYNYPGTSLVHRRNGEDGEPLSQVALNIQMVLNSYSQAENSFLTGRQHILQQLNRQLNTHAVLMPAQTRHQLADKAERALQQPAVTVNNHTQIVQAQAQGTFAPKKKDDFSVNRIFSFPSYLHTDVHSSFKTPAQQQLVMNHSIQQALFGLNYNQVNMAQSLFVQNRLTQGSGYNLLAKYINQPFMQAIFQPGILLTGPIAKLSTSQYGAQHIFRQFIMDGGSFDQTAAGAIAPTRELTLEYMRYQQLLAENNVWQRQIALSTHLTKLQTAEKPSSVLQSPPFLPPASAGRDYQALRQKHQEMLTGRLTRFEVSQSLNLLTTLSVPMFTRLLSHKEQVFHREQLFNREQLSQGEQLLHREQLTYVEQSIQSEQPLPSAQPATFLHMPALAVPRLYQQQKATVGADAAGDYKNAAALVENKAFTLLRQTNLLQVFPQAFTPEEAANIYHSTQIWRQALPLVMLTQKREIALTQIAGLKLITEKELPGKKMQPPMIFLPEMRKIERVISQIAGIKPQIELTGLYHHDKNIVVFNAADINVLKEASALRLINRITYAGRDQITQQYAGMQNILRQYFANYNKKQEISHKKFVGHYALQQSVDQQYILAPNTDWHPVLLKNSIYKHITAHKSSLQNIERQSILHRRSNQQHNINQAIAKHSSVNNSMVKQSIILQNNYRQHFAGHSSFKPYIILKNITMPNTVQQKILGKALDSANLLNVKYIHIEEKISRLPLEAKRKYSLVKPLLLAAEKIVRAAPVIGLAHPPGLPANEPEAMGNAPLTADNIIYLRRESIEDVAAQVLARQGAAGSLSMDVGGEYLGEAALEAQTLNSGMYRPQAATPLSTEPVPQAGQPVEPLVEDVMEQLLRGTNITQLADKVYEAFERRIKYEKRRFGL